jgi:predicted metal-dependent phosphoesterase TrpH
MSHDSFCKPTDIYRRLKKKGMDYVTITDHDSIEGCLSFLNKNPDCTDFFISEEVSVPLKEFANTIHVNVYDIDEAKHEFITSLKKDAFGLLSYLNEEKVKYCLNHFFVSLPKDQRKWHDFMKFVDKNFTSLETKNSAQFEIQNNMFNNGVFSQKNFVSGSDAHTFADMAQAYTLAAGDTYNEFLDNVFSGKSKPIGKSSNVLKLARSFNSVYYSYGFDCLKTPKRRLNRFGFLKRMFKFASWIVFAPLFSIMSTMLISTHYLKIKFKASGLYKKLYFDYQKKFNRQ